MSAGPILKDEISAGSKVRGFNVNGVSCDVRNKGDGRLDLCVVHSKAPCSAAGLFTKNDVQAAPVILSRELISTGEDLHGIVCNSGNANAFTGKQGLDDCLAPEGDSEF